MNYIEGTVVAGSLNSHVQVQRWFEGMTVGMEQAPPRGRAGGAR